MKTAATYLGVNLFQSSWRKPIEANNKMSNPDIVKIKAVQTSNATAVFTIPDTYQADHTGSFNSADVVPTIAKKKAD